MNKQKTSNDMKEYIKPEIMCVKIECMQIMETSLTISTQEAKEDACSKEQDMSSTSLWDEVDD